jgi:hypothetical protein
MATNVFLSTATQSWGATANWSLGAIPTINDLVIFTASSGTCSVNVVGTCSSIDFTNYNKRITFSNPVWSYGNVIYGSNMGYSYSTTNGIIVASTASITSGATISAPLTLYSNNGASSTFTLNNSLNMDALFSTQFSSTASTATITINGFTISCRRGITINTGNNVISNLTTGTTNIELVGANTQVYTNGFATTTGGLSNNFTINSTGTITTLGGNIYYKTGTFTYLRGIMTAASVLQFTSGATFDPSGTSASNIINLNIRGTGTITLNSNFYTSNGVATQVAGGLTLNNNNVYIYGGSLGAATGVLTGTTNLIVTGTSSTSTVNISTTQNVSNPIVINSPGIVTFTQLLVSNAGSVTYTAGNVNVVGQFIIGLGLNLTYTLGTNGITFGTTIINGASGNLSLTNLFSTNTLTVNNSGQIFGLTGSAGFSVNTLSNLGTLKLKEGLTYTTNTNIVCYTPGNTDKFSSWATGSVAYLNHKGASQSLYSMTVIDIDSSGGNTLWVYRPVSLTNTTNWNTLTIANLQSSNINCS